MPDLAARMTCDHCRWYQPRGNSLGICRSQPPTPLERDDRIADVLPAGSTSNSERLDRAEPSPRLTSLPLPASPSPTHTTHPSLTGCHTGHAEDRNGRGQHRRATRPPGSLASVPGWTATARLRSEAATRRPSSNRLTDESHKRSSSQVSQAQPRSEMRTAKGST